TGSGDEITCGALRQRSRSGLERRFRLRNRGLRGRSFGKHRRLTRRPGLWKAKAIRLSLGTPPKYAPPPAAIIATYCLPSFPRYVTGIEWPLASIGCCHRSFPVFESK